MYLETKRALLRNLPELRKQLCVELNLAMGSCRDCRQHFDIFGLHACTNSGHGPRCLELDFACRCNPIGTWHLSRLEVHGLILEAPN